MALRVYNTLSRKKEEIKPIKGKKINLFVCGPTVYDLPHIGHAKTYLAFDVIVRYLRYKGFDVFYLQNITDIDDKIIKRAGETGDDPLKLAKKFAEEYFKDMESLGVDSVSKYAFATKYISQIIKQIQTLLDKKYAYKIEDGYYFDLSKFKEYGKLSGRTALESEDAVTRIDESVGKKSKGDFCLWKFSKAGEPMWDAPFGKGRPGWHIEDTAITEAEFGPQYDIHGGARDLIFPHHEAEIAQMEAASGKKPLVKYWIHTGFLNVSGQKMSKSLGNFITIRDAISKWNSNLLRFFFLSSHYRSPIDFSEKSLDNAKTSLNKLISVYDKLKGFSASGAKNVLDVKKYSKRFYDAMDDDINTPKALAVMFEFVSEINKADELSKKDVEDALKVLDEFANVLQIILKGDKIPKEIQDLVKKRKEARNKKDYKEADRIRDELDKKGYIVEDSPEGFKVRLK